MSRDFFPLFPLQQKNKTLVPLSWSWLSIYPGLLWTAKLSEHWNRQVLYTSPHPDTIPSNPIQPTYSTTVLHSSVLQCKWFKTPRTTLLKAHHRLFWDGAKASNKYFAADKSWFSWIFETNYISLKHIILEIHIILFQNI